MGRRCDLTNQQFGSLRVLSPAANRGDRTCWNCLCSCGRETVATTHDLKAGKVKSCGCMKYVKAHNRIDISGRRFVRLTALYPTKKRDRKGSVYWHCLCDCGNETDVTEDGLVHGNYKSCGCLRREVWDNIPNRLQRVDGTCVEWLEKRKHRSDNTSGFRGVYVTKSGHYRVSIGFKGKRYYLGRFEQYQKAVEARMEAEQLIHNGFVKAYYKWKQQAKEDEDWAQSNPLVFEVVRDRSGLSVITNL